MALPPLFNLGPVARALRQWLNARGFDVRRFTADNGPRIDVLDLAVRDVRAHHEDFFFVQVGANDGTTFDPIHALVSELHLAGLCVEPMPDAYADLQASYADQPQVRCANCAISERDGHRTLYRLRPGAYDTLGARALAGFDKETLLRHRAYYPDLEKNIEAITVPTLSLTSLLRQYEVTRVDLLLVDTEGYDFEVLKMTFDAGLRPRIISYEHAHLTPADQVACRDMLAGEGYAFSSTRVDTLALRPDTRSRS